VVISISISRGFDWGKTLRDAQETKSRIRCGVVISVSISRGFDWGNFASRTRNKITYKAERIKMPKRGVNWAFLKINCKN
jgi:hypothetical protein